MKWVNKGHEFDEMGTKISSIKKVVLFGAGLSGKTTYTLLKEHLEIVGFIDNNPQKKDSGFLGLPVYSPEFFKKVDCDDIAIIITVARGIGAPAEIHDNIIKQMEAFGYVYKNNLFLMKEFLPIYMWYKNKKLITHGCLIAVTDKCSLNCKYCNVFTPFLKEPQHIGLSKLQNDIDCLLNAFDYVGNVVLVGGETLLHPRLKQIIEYICENYMNKIGYVVILTNGTIKLSDEILKVLKKYKQNIEVLITDYSSTLSQYKNITANVLNSLRCNDIKTRISIHETWLDFGFETVNRKNASEDELIAIFDTCAIECQSIKNGKYYKCDYDVRAFNIGFIKEDSGFDLVNFDKKDKPTLMEYCLGYSDKGYVELCKRCNGISRNNHYIPVAEQAIRK